MHFYLFITFSILLGLSILSGIWLTFFSYPSFIDVFQQQLTTKLPRYIDLFFHNFHSLIGLFLVGIFGILFFIFFLKVSSFKRKEDLLWANLFLCISFILICVTFILGLTIPWNELVAYKWHLPFSAYYGGNLKVNSPSDLVFLRLRLIYTLHVIIPFVFIIIGWISRKILVVKFKQLMSL
jgi:hypothetical protein